MAGHGKWTVAHRSAASQARVATDVGGGKDRSLTYREKRLRQVAMTKNNQQVEFGRWGKTRKLAYVRK